MAKRGRKPAPIGLKLLKGGRAGRIPAPAAPSGRAEPPDDLAPVAMAEWHRIARLTGATEADCPHLDLYAGAYERLKVAQADLRANGLVVVSGPAEAQKANPAAAVAKAAEDTMMKTLAELNRRATLRQSSAGPKDDLGEFLARQA